MLFPRQFVDDLRSHADIVVVIQDYVSLRKAGAGYKGLCPFHNERTPSFHVNRDKGFFHCFSCGVGGDVFKFLSLHEKIGFQDAVKQLAQRFGIPLPELEQNDEQRASAAERETLLKIHEMAAAWFREQLMTPAGARIRRQIADRGISDATSEAMGLGYAPASRDGLKQVLLKQGLSEPALLRAGVLVQREEGGSVDRFRNRLIIPIRRDTGSVIAFGGRAVASEQQPKYLNSPETPIYTKGRTLYGLDLSKAAVRQKGFAILVEGYFDFGQVYQAGFPVVASCGTALTAQQAQQLHRFASKVVLSFDPDAAGQGAAAKSCELFVAEGFDINVTVLPAGEDPDTFIRAQGAAGYGERLKRSQPYLEYLLDRAAMQHNLRTPEGRARFIDEVLPIVNRIPDRTRQELFVKEVSSRANVSEEAIWPRAKKAVTERSAGISHSQLPALGQVTKSEKALIWSLIHQPATALAALADLEPPDLEGLASRSVLDLAWKLNEDRGFSPSVLLERLTMVEAQLVTAIASEPEPPALSLASCVREVRRCRYERERTIVQREIAQLQTRGAATGGELDALLVRKSDLVRLIQALVVSED